MKEGREERVKRRENISINRSWRTERKRNGGKKHVWEDNLMSKGERGMKEE